MEDEAAEPLNAQRFAAGIRHARDGLGMSQRELAMRMETRGFAYYPQTVTKLERGERAVPIAEALALADELHTDVYALIRPPEVTRQAYTILRTMREVITDRDAADGAEAAYADACERLRQLVKEAEQDAPEALRDEIAAGKRALEYKGKRYRV